MRSVLKNKLLWKASKSILKLGFKILSAAKQTMEMMILYSTSSIIFLYLKIQEFCSYKLHMQNSLYFRKKYKLPPLPNYRGRPNYPPEPQNQIFFTLN